MTIEDSLDPLQQAVTVAQMKEKPTARPLKAGDFFEVHGVCYTVTKISHKGTVFCKPFTGRLAVPRGTATATQLQGARKA